MKIQIPTKCPSCASELTLVNSQLFCTNDECPAQSSKRLESFAKALDIKGLGPKLAEKLQLHIQEPFEIFGLTEEQLSAILESEKLGSKLFAQLSAAKNTTIPMLLQAFSIPLIGATTSEKFSKVSSLDEITQELCKQLGLGDKATDHLTNWVVNYYTHYKDEIDAIFSIKPVNTPSGNLGKVCITGKLKSFKTKAEAAKALESLGYQVVDDVTKDVVLLIDETGGTSQKHQKALNYGINIVTNLKTLLEK